MSRFWWWPSKSLSQSRLWALAAGGVHTKFNSEPFDRLRFECGPAHSEICLRDWWGVNGVADLARTLQWLWEEGHSRNCMEFCESMPPPGAGKVLRTGTDPVCAFIQSNRVELQTSRLVAWDLSRLVNVARWGYTAAYIDEGEAWSWILLAARKLQQSFRSWAALGRDFVLGYEFWWRIADQSRDADVERAYQWLLSDRQSPWRQLAWDTPLSDT